MTKQIRTYQDLLDEKERLQSLLKAQKEIIHNDFREIKEELNPVRAAISYAGKFFSRDTGGNLVLNMGANTLIDVLVKRLLLGRAGWLVRTVVPFLLKNYSSHVIHDNKDTIWNKITAWLGKRNAKGKSRSNGQFHHEEETNPDMLAKE